MTFSLSLADPADADGRVIGICCQSTWRWPGIVGLCAVLLAAGCAQTAPPAREKKAVEVVATTPVGGEVTDYQDFTGRLDALKTVDIRARVSGFVMEAPFKEGDMVREGQLLFLIDPRTYQADLNQAQANLKQAEADRNLQDKQSARAKKLIATNSIGQEEYDQMVASNEKSRATVGSMEAARDRAKLFVDYTRVISPLSGRVSRRQVDPGNLVKADDTVLTTVVSDNPLYAYFDVDERTYLDLGEASHSARSSWFAGLQFPVMMRLANEESFTRTGNVDFIDNRVTATTGTIRMRAAFENPTGMLKSGLFVRIRLPIGAPYQTLFIPDEAVLSDQGRKYVFVVNDNNEVVYRPVTLGQEIQKLRAVKDGLKKGDRVIVGGMQRVKAKMQVEVKMQDPPKPPPSPLGKLLAEHGLIPAVNKSAEAPSSKKDKG